ncbi:DUF6234 family protein [Kitasatospora sp. NBC_01539]|uniref:DUF6234 family protein n=1 Tax=Kitasatospora sp. NBC_01539 TaxID=2903577 RepID=UPI00386025AD
MPATSPAPGRERDREGGRGGGRRIAADLLLALGLLCLEVLAAGYTLLVLAFGSREADPAGAATVPPFDWSPIAALGGFGAFALLVAVLAGRDRWWITTVAHGLLAAVLLLGAAAAGVGRQHDRQPPARPEPLPSGYTPCFSGSGRCN